MRPRPRRPSAPVRTALKRSRDAEAQRGAERARAALAAAAREVARARAAALRLLWSGRYDALVAAGLAFDSAGGRPPPRRPLAAPGPCPAGDAADESFQTQARSLAGGDPP